MDLIYAAMDGNLALVVEELENGADVDFRDVEVAMYPLRSLGVSLCSGFMEKLSKYLTTLYILVLVPSFNGCTHCIPPHTS